MSKVVDLLHSLVYFAEDQCLYHILWIIVVPFVNRLPVCGFLCRIIVVPFVNRLPARGYLISWYTNHGMSKMMLHFHSCGYIWFIGIGRILDPHPCQRCIVLAYVNRFLAHGESRFDHSAFSFSKDG